jgi:hypothetical protein
MQLSNLFSQSSRTLTGLCLTRLCLTGLSLSLPIATTMALVRPATAATFAESRATSSLFNFSHRAAAIDARTLRDAIAIGQPSQVLATAFADAQFSLSGTGLAQDVSISTAQGLSGSYLAAAKSEASVAGFDFQVHAGDTFKFDLSSILGVFATADQPDRETALASGDINFEIYETTADNKLNLLESLNLNGTDRATSPATPSQFDLSNTSGFQVSTQRNDRAFRLDGTFARRFNQNTRLSIFEVKRNRAFVTVPESSATVALIGLAGTGLLLRRSRDRR